MTAQPHTPERDTLRSPRTPVATPVDPAENHSAPGSWHLQTMLDTPLGELVNDLDRIATLSVPYTRLPHRLSTYADEFPRWTNLAATTPRELLERPKLGVAAIGALIEAAREGVQISRDAAAAGPVGAHAAVTRLLARLPEFDRTLLQAQEWSLQPVAQHVLADRLRVHQASVQRNLPRARSRFAELLADPAHHDVNDHADNLRQRLGPYVPVNAAHLELRRLGLEPAGESAHVLLSVAGPYALHDDDWLENLSSPGGGGRARAQSAVDEVLDTQPAPATATLLHALTRHGMPTGIAMTYLESMGTLHRFGDVWVRWGNEATTKSAAALHFLSTPSTAAAIVAIINSAADPGAAVTCDRINAVLSTDDRFLRATRTKWALRTWNLPAYQGIAHAMGELIDAHGGAVTVEEIKSELRSRYPDVSEASIRTYLRTLPFIAKRGIVRRRTSADGWPAPVPLNTIRGVFRNGDNEIRLAIPVTSELLRGSGQSIQRSVAAAVGVSPGGRRTFTGRHGDVRVYSVEASTNGAKLGALRAQAEAVQATTGDTLVIALRPCDGTMEAIRLRPDETGRARLEKLLGHAVRNPVAALAAGLGCPRSRVHDVLRARGDGDLARTFAQRSPASP